MEAAEERAAHARAEAVIDPKEKAGQQQRRHAEGAQVVSESVTRGGAQFAADNRQDDHRGAFI